MAEGKRLLLLKSLFLPIPLSRPFYLFLIGATSSSGNQGNGLFSRRLCASYDSVQPFARPVNQQQVTASTS